MNFKAEVSTSEIGKYNQFESLKRTAEATAKFYNSLLDAYLDSSVEQPDSKIPALLKGLPSHMRGLYGEGINRYKMELEANHRLLEQNRGQEVSYLFGAVLRSDGKSDEDIKDILSNATPDKARLIEPSRGVAIIETETEYFRFLQEKGLISYEASAVAFLADNREEPSFMVVRRGVLEKGLSSDQNYAAQKPSVRHELHHFIWSFLQRSGFLREINETDPDSAKAFGNFRDEISAYILQKRPLKEVTSYLLTYSKDPEILKMAAQIMNHAIICMEAAKFLGIDSQMFLYPAMISRNFNELKKNFSTLVNLSGEMDENGINVLYRVWSGNSSIEMQFRAFLQEKNITFSFEALSQFQRKQLNPDAYESLGDLYIEADHLNRFAKATSTGQVEPQIVREIIKNKLELPDAVIDAIMTLPQRDLRDIPLINKPDDLLKRIISFFMVSDQRLRSIYKDIIDSSSVMREAFNRIREEIITSGEAVYRMECSRPERKERTEAEIEERKALLLSL